MRSFDARRRGWSSRDRNDFVGRSACVTVTILPIEGLRAEASQNQYERAIADFQSASRIDNRPWRLGVLGWALGVADKRSEATAILHKLQAISRQTTVPPWSFAIVYIGLGQTDQAFAWLEKAYAEHSSDLRALKVDPVYDPLRSNPRFQDLLRRVGLPP